jgi:hypothetical protein
MIQQAAERLRPFVNETPHRECEEMWTLARAWLAEHPADDDKPLLDSELPQFGFTNRNTPDWPVYQSLDSVNGGPACNITVDSMMGCDGWEVGYSNHRVMIPPPNGKRGLRQLLAGLGIPLSTEDGK